MVTWNQVKGTYDDTRAFYKKDLKSNNKAYYAVGAHKQDEQVQTAPGAVLSATQQTRNLNVSKVDRLYMTVGRPPKDWKGKTNFEVGRDLHNAGTKSGNCGEMSMVALFLAIDRYHVPRNEVVMHTTRYSQRSGLSWSDFGHTFLTLGTVPAPQTYEYAVDPWAGVCCRWPDYATLLTAQLQKWAGQGKRISVGWTFGAFWTVPTDSTITGLIGNDAKWIQEGPDTRF